MGQRADAQEVEMLKVRKSEWERRVLGFRKLFEDFPFLWVVRNQWSLGSVNVQVIDVKSHEHSFHDFWTSLSPWTDVPFEVWALVGRKYLHPNDSDKREMRRIGVYQHDIHRVGGWTQFDWQRVARDALVFEPIIYIVAAEQLSHVPPCAWQPIFVFRDKDDESCSDLFHAIEKSAPLF